MKTEKSNKTTTSNKPMPVRILREFYSIYGDIAAAKGSDIQHEVNQALKRDLKRKGKLSNINTASNS